MRKRLLRIVAFLTTLLLSLVPFRVFALETSMVKNEGKQIVDKEKAIQALFDERAALLAELFSEDGLREETEIDEKIAVVDGLLESYDVEILSDQQVMSMLENTSSEFEYNLFNGADVASAKANPPSSSVNTWFNTRTTITYNGVSYNIQTLTAQPNSPASPLALSGTEQIQYSNNWQAGAAAALDTSAKAIVGGFMSEIPGASLFLTIFDVVSAVISEIDQTTVVSIPSMTYGWSGVTTACFKYVRRNNQSDDEQWLSLVSTRVTLEVDFIIPAFDNVGGNDNTVLSPNNITGSRTITAIPPNYASNYLAIDKYNTYPGGPWQECVSYVQITGAESKLVRRVVCCCPFYPLQCE